VFLLHRVSHCDANSVHFVSNGLAQVHVVCCGSTVTVVYQVSVCVQVNCDQVLCAYSSPFQLSMYTCVLCYLAVFHYNLRSI